MGSKIWFRSLVTCAVVALCAVPAFAQKGGQKPGSWDRLIANLERDGFVWQEGESVHFDPIGKYCYGDFPNALYANYGAPYASGIIPASPRLPEGTPDVEDPPIKPVFRLDPDEAVVLVGTTPPAEAYFSYQIYLAFRNYPGDTEPRLLLNSLGDTVNIHTINTIGPDPFERPMVIILTPDRGIDSRLRAALRRAGYPASIINTIEIPSATLKLGFEDDSDVFLLANRNAIWADETAGDAYIAKPTFRVLRLTPEDAGELDPFPTAPLRIRGTGQTEIDLTPTLARLREAILDFYGSGYTAKEYITAEVANEGFDYTQRQRLTLGDTRDALYLGAGYMKEFDLQADLTLADGEFLIAYGLDHVATGKATYINVNAYDSGPPKMALGSAFPVDLKDSAYQYLGWSDPDGALTWAVKISRNCATDESFCMQLTVPDGCTHDGEEVVLDETTPIGIGFRLYLEPGTSIGPAYSEIVYDQIIKFTPSARERD
jgi:hypothetical protein